MKRILLDNRPTWLLVKCVALVAALSALAVAVAACADLTDTSGTVAETTVTTVLETTTIAPTSESTTTTSAAPTTAAAPTTTTTVVGVSDESKAYAASIGGTDRYGQTLWFVIGQGALSSEAQAKTLLEPAKAVGDMQSYFIVQLSDNFDGMTPGYWIIFEAYSGYPEEHELEFCRRPFPDCYVKKATVMTHDPIPLVR